jgi:hypothetical protein
LINGITLPLPYLLPPEGVKRISEDDYTFQSRTTREFKSIKEQGTGNHFLLSSGTM